MKLLILACVLLGGCASINDYCEVHPIPCVVATGVVVVGAAVLVAGKISSDNQVKVIQNPPPKN